MVLTVGLDHKNGTAAGARKSFKATVEVTLAVALPGERGESPRLLRGVISASVLRDMLGSLRPKGRGSRHRRKRTGRGFGRFQTYLGATTRCLLFAGTGGVYLYIYPVAYPPRVRFIYFALFLCLFYPTANVPDTSTWNQSQTSTFPVLLSQTSKERSDVAIA